MRTPGWSVRTLRHVVLALDEVAQGLLDALSEAAADEAEHQAERFRSGDLRAQRIRPWPGCRPPGPPPAQSRTSASPGAGCFTTRRPLPLVDVPDECAAKCGAVTHVPGGSLP